MPKVSILVVDDDPLVRRTVERALVRAGYDVRVAASATDALEALAEAPVDLVVSDVMMDDMEGPAFGALARQRRPDLRLLFMSGETPENLPAVGLDKATTPFLPKPFRPEDLLAKVAELVSA